MKYAKHPMYTCKLVQVLFFDICQLLVSSEVCGHRKKECSHIMSVCFMLFLFKNTLKNGDHVGVGKSQVFPLKLSSISIQIDSISILINKSLLKLAELLTVVAK